MNIKSLIIDNTVYRVNWIYEMKSRISLSIAAKDDQYLTA